jgi:hypothetical protein
VKYERRGGWGYLPKKRTELAKALNLETTQILSNINKTHLRKWIPAFAGKTRQEKLLQCKRKSRTKRQQNAPFIRGNNQSLIKYIRCLPWIARRALRLAQDERRGWGATPEKKTVLAKAVNLEARKIIQSERMTHLRKT